MADKPSYKVARKARGTATMTIEPAPKTSFTDKEMPSPDSERFPKGSLSPEDNAKGDATIVNPITHPGEYALSAKHSDLSKT